MVGVGGWSCLDGKQIVRGLRGGLEVHVKVLGGWISEDKVV